jgi:hypothetical protein
VGAKTAALEAAPESERSNQERPVEKGIAVVEHSQTNKAVKDSAV